MKAHLESRGLFWMFSPLNAAAKEWLLKNAPDTGGVLTLEPRNVGAAVREFQNAGGELS